MVNYAHFTMADGASISIESGETGPVVTGGTVKVSRVGGDVLQTAGETFESALDRLKPLSMAIIDQFRNLAVPPDEAVVEFGFSLKAEAGFIIAKCAPEGNFKVKLTWKRSGTPTK